MNAAAKKESPWSKAGAEPELRDLLRDGIVLTLMEKDKVGVRDLLRLIWSIRPKIAPRRSLGPFRRDGQP